MPWNKIPVENYDGGKAGPYIMEFVPEIEADNATITFKTKLDLNETAFLNSIYANAKLDDILTKETIERMERNVLWGKHSDTKEYNESDQYISYRDLSHHITAIEEVDNDIIVTVQTFPTERGLMLKKLIELGTNHFAKVQYFKDSMPNINILYTL